MSLFDRFGDWVIRRAQRTPYFHLEGYMERWWLLRLGRWGMHDNETPQAQGPRPILAARVHHILRSDSGREFHDHPWPFVTIILRGGYTEVRPIIEEYPWVQLVGEARRYYPPGSILFRRASDWHRLELEPGTTAWTLFITGPQLQRWGFLVDGVKVYWRTFLFGELEPEPRPSRFARWREAALRIWTQVRE
jgi:hypothetical protein